MTDATERLRTRIAFVEDAMRHTYDLRYDLSDLHVDRQILASLDEITRERDAAVKQAEEAEAFTQYLRSMMSLGTWETVESEQAWKRRATAAEERVRVLTEALTQCSDQFAFYASEHTTAGKIEKAATNQRFADLATGTLSMKDAG